MYEKYPEIGPTRGTVWKIHFHSINTFYIKYSHCGPIHFKVNESIMEGL